VKAQIFGLKIGELGDLGFALRCYFEIEPEGTEFRRFEDWRK